MGFFVSDEGNKIEVKDRGGATANVWIREMSFEDSQKRIAKLVKGANMGGLKLAGGKANRMGNDAANLNFDLSKVADIRRETLERAIVDWDFTDAAGDKVPVTKENIGRLSQFVANQIYEAIQELDALPEDEEGEDGEVIPHPTLQASEGE